MKQTVHEGLTSYKKSLPDKYNDFENKKWKIEDKDVKRGLNRFMYRYRLAKEFHSINASAVGKTLAGYEAALKVFLAYCAYEVLIGAAKKVKGSGVRTLHKNSVRNAKLSKRLRTNDELFRFLEKNLEQDILIKSVEDFKLGKSDDIACVCCGVRHVFAHGKLTPSAIGLKTKQRTRDLFDMADELLAYSNATFTNCVNKI
jgi:hypothetical protein